MQHTQMTLPALVLQILILLLAKVEGNPISKSVLQNGTSLSTQSSSSSSWLKKVTLNNRDWGCRRRPWICSQGQFPIQRVCCRNRCVDVTSDRQNCGSCEIKCIFNSLCCEGLCTDTNIDPYNCGGCGNRCPNGEPCFFGMCGYAQPSPPLWPPRPPKLPQPPHHRRPPAGGQEPPAAVEQIIVG